MARPKRRNPLLTIAQSYVNNHIPELADAKLVVRQLDGPPEGPRFVVMAEECTTSDCPHHIAPEVAAAGQCPVKECALRCSIRLLLTRRGEVVQEIRSGIQWR